MVPYQNGGRHCISHTTILCTIKLSNTDISPHLHVSSAHVTVQRLHCALLSPSTSSAAVRIHAPSDHFSSTVSTPQPGFFPVQPGSLALTHFGTGPMQGSPPYPNPMTLLPTLISYPVPQLLHCCLTYDSICCLIYDSIIMNASHLPSPTIRTLLYIYMECACSLTFGAANHLWPHWVWANLNRVLE